MQHTSSTCEQGGYLHTGWWFCGHPAHRCDCSCAFSKVQLHPFSGSNHSTGNQSTCDPVTVVVTSSPTPTPTQVPEVNQTPQPPAAPYRITYMSNPFTYPVIHLPDHMESFGASDVPLAWAELPFAYIEESRRHHQSLFGALRDMGIEYERHREPEPQYAMFRMALCDARQGISSRVPKYRIPVRCIRSSGSQARGCI